METVLKSVLLLMTGFFYTVNSYRGRITTESFSGHFRFSNESMIAHLFFILKGVWSKQS